MPLAQIVRIDTVEDHPDTEKSSHLSIMRVGDMQGVSMKVGEPDALQHRYSPGDLVLAVFDGAVCPEYLLRRGFWNDDKNIGMLPGGKKGNRMKPSKFNGVVSEFIMFPVSPSGEYESGIISNETESDQFNEGTEVSGFLGIVAHVA